MPRLHIRLDSTVQHVMDRVREHVTDWLGGRALRAADLRSEIKCLLEEMLDEERLDRFDVTGPNSPLDDE